MLLLRPMLTSTDFRALPVRLLISLSRKALSALFIIEPLVLPSERYMPVVSMVTAILLRCSTERALSSLLTV